MRERQSHRAKGDQRFALLYSGCVCVRACVRHGVSVCGWVERREEERRGKAWYAVHDRLTHISVDSLRTRVYWRHAGDCASMLI